MASSLTAKKLSTELQVKHFDFDPNATTATAVEWVDMSVFTKLMVSFFRTVGTSAVTMVIQAATSAAGANAQTVVSKTVSDEPDAVGDYIFLECIAQQIAEVAKDTGYALRYASAVISVATGTDEGVVTYVLGGGRFCYDSLTEDSVAS